MFYIEIESEYVSIRNQGQVRGLQFESRNGLEGTIERYDDSVSHLTHDSHVECPFADFNHVDLLSSVCLVSRKRRRR